MADFDLEAFISAPTLGQLDKCRKDDLIRIAAHYQISVLKQQLKREIKNIVLQKLVELGVLVLPPFEPFSPASAVSGVDARLKVRLARVQMDARERAEDRQAERELRLKIRRLEIEAEMQIKMRELDLKAAKSAPAPVVQPQLAAVAPSEGAALGTNFDVSKNISLVPQFRETEVDSYFGVFERIACALNWSREVWPLLLQCKLTGKAQEVCATLSLEDSLKYDAVKAAILRAYELVPEAYRQRFRSHKKNFSQTFVEFAREKGALFDKWCTSSKITDFKTLRELILLEEFKNCIPERVVVYLNEHKVTSLSQASVFADEFALTHKNVFIPARPDKTASIPVTSSNQPRPKLNSHKVKEGRECFYCHKSGQLIADCLVLKRKQQGSTTKSVGFVNTVVAEKLESAKPDCSYEPFLMEGFISVSGKPTERVRVKMLRDTGTTQSFVVAGVLPFSEQTSCGSNVLVQGIEMGLVKVPLHQVHLQSELCTGFVKVGVRDCLPVNGVEFILGNDSAGGKVFPMLEVFDKPVLPDHTDELSEIYPETFPACVVTRAQARQMDADDLSTSFMVPIFVEDFLPSDEEKEMKTSPNLSSSHLKLPVTREKIVFAQKEDSSLQKCFSAAVSVERAQQRKSAYFLEDGLLMRKWSPIMADDPEWSVVYQVVIPECYRQQVLSLAHDHNLSGHLGIKKTYHRVLRHFFWPCLKAGVIQYCRTCRTCQLMGKPNQTIPSAPLVPIPVVDEPFEHVIVDCVGPLPKTRSGNQFLLTVMCSATRFPEAIPLRKITAPVVVKALVKFFSTFGLPKVVQTDQGTNFLSKLFSQVLTTLNISHRIASAYHPESQDALERFHQTLKAMLRKYCLDTGKDWDEGVPLVLFAVREAV